MRERGIERGEREIMSSVLAPVSVCVYSVHVPVRTFLLVSLWRPEETLGLIPLAHSLCRWRVCPTGLELAE